MLIIGLTGGIGSGKTTVANYFAELGITIIDADLIAREVTAQQTVTEKIMQHFGPNILDQTQQINRTKLRDVIFNNSNEREWLEQLLHPLIRQKIQQDVAQATSDYVILVIPLLIEKGRGIKTDRILVIDIPEALQAQRVQQRDNINAEQFKLIADTQVSRAERLRVADDVIHNNGSLTELKQQVEILHQQYLQLSKKIVVPVGKPASSCQGC